MNKLFYFSDIFEIEKHKYIDFDKTKPGNVNLIGLSGFNNGLRAKILPPNNLFINEGNCITIPLDGEYMGTAFYQEEKFITTQNVHIIRLKTKNIILNQNIALFLCVILRKLRDLFFYGRKLTKERILEQKIWLPIDDKNQPNFEYMNNFIKNNWDLAVANLINYKIKKNKNYKINTNDWKYVNVSDIFFIEGTKTSKNLITNYSNYNYVTTKATNNGVENYALIYTEAGGVITVDSATNGVCFYQEEKFIASDHVEKLVPKFSNVTKKNMLFFVTLLNKYKNDFYHYGYKRAKIRIIKEKIKVPLDKNNKIDFNKIEEIMNNLNWYET